MVVYFQASYMNIRVLVDKYTSNLSLTVTVKQDEYIEAF